MKTDLRVWGLDLLRAVAILLVLLLHSNEFVVLGDTAAHFFYFGWAGVDLFFVLSGFLIGSQAYRNTQVVEWGFVKRFWVRRWWRTIPLYLCVLFVYVVIKPLAGYPFQEKIWPFFIFLQNFFSPKDFVQSWSLCIEEQFYFFLPLLLWIFSFQRKFPAWIWLLFLGSSTGFRFLAMNSSMNLSDAAYQLQFPTHTHFDGITMGLFLAATREKWTGWTIARKNLLAIVGVGLLIFTFCKGSPTLNDSSALWVFSTLALGFAALIPAAIELSSSPSLFHRVIEYVALWSYGLYLWNNLVFRLAERLPLPLLVRGIFAWAITFAVAALTYYFVELPGLRWRDRILQKLS